MVYAWLLCLCVTTRSLLHEFHVMPNLIPYLGIGGGGVYRDFGNSTASVHSTNPAFQVMAGLRFQLNEFEEIGFGYKFLDAFSGQSDLRTHSLSAVWVLRF